jgi:hypothetical protein
MPRYFFHMSDSLGRTSDHAGSYFRIEQEAREGALETAKQIVVGRRMNRKSDSFERGGYIEVTDEQGHTVFTVPLSASAHASGNSDSS